jgi:hypothetical protein
LYQKRKELVYLKEEATRLQIQLKTKRRNLTTLEKLIENANAEDLETKKPSQPSGHALVKFFVAFPDGKFIELEESSEITIKYLNSIINNLLFYETMTRAKAAAGGKSSTDPFHGSADREGNIKLYLKGKLLMSSSTLAQNGVMNGDTLLATVIGFGETSVVEKKEVEQPMRAEAKDDATTRTLIEALTAQTDCISKLAREIK